MYTAKARVLGLVEIKTKDRPGTNSVAVISISVGIIPVVRETPKIRPIVLMPVITLVVSPITVRPVASPGWDGKNSQADGERAKENQKFVHNKALCSAVQK
jgi:hypothetical protein